VSLLGERDVLIAYLAAIGIGFLIGLIVGRWWAVLAGVGFAIWIGVSTEVDEVPPWFLALVFGVLAAGAIGAGVAIRRGLRRVT
jgi:hypothetical protein